MVRRSVVCAQWVIMLCLHALSYHEQEQSSDRERERERELSVFGPTTWNSLPESPRTVDCIATLKRQLKTHFFNSYLCRHF